jgi:hypothetical protein
MGESARPVSRRPAADDGELMEDMLLGDGLMPLGWLICGTGWCMQWFACVALPSLRRLLAHVVCARLAALLSA